MSERETITADPSKLTRLLAIESSCDDTSIAILEGASSELPKLLALSVQSQNDIHERYGGVVPELASRAHLQNLLPCLEKVLAETKLELSDIDVFSATGEPGLVGSLLVGHAAARTLALLHRKPFLSCNHLEGHLFSVFLEEKNLPEFPYLALIVSGGHTSLYRVDSFESYELLSQTLDDAIGEAYDKGAKLLGLPFPGGPELDRLASAGNRERYRFKKVIMPLPHFSFGGLKSELFRFLQKEKTAEKADVAAAYQEALLHHLFSRIEWAIETTGIKRLAIVGGVARNSQLRNQLNLWLSNGRLEKFYCPRPELCTDNAAMIGFVAFKAFQRGESHSLQEDIRSTARPNAKSIRRAQESTSS